MDPQYDHTKFEREIYKKWEESGAFKARPINDSSIKPFTILMPPPNANASLHAGHAMYTVDDILIRYKRMQGFSALWIPGRDHAGFETQYVYEKNLAKEGKSRMDFDRKTLYDNIFDFVKNNSNLIFEQFKRLGFSADWDRTVFSLDENVINQVFETFKKMESEGLVFRDDYIVNYCTHCGTSLAELEVKHIERIDPLYYIKYGPFVLATVRPETKFGDTAVAVHPKDKRYVSWVGKEIEVEGLLGKFKLQVIADEFVDPEFGTGVVKVTPAHDPNDFEMGKRHKLGIKKIIDLNGRLTDLAGPYAGLKVKIAREKVVEDLKNKGLMEKIDENYLHSVTVCYKCGHDLEPMTIPNWYVRVTKLKEEVKEVVEKDKVKFYPKKFKRHMLAWLDIMHDWPISRQIAWGIRIPVWYDVEKNPVMQVSFIDKKGEKKFGKVSNFNFDEVQKGLQSIIAPANAKYVVSEDKPKGNFLPETDTFDTWFSSSQWPLVTLEDNEYKTRFPTDVLGTLSEILKFWVSRMIMFSLYLKKEIPFKNVYLWSMVTDSKGVKMSKSKGNVVNPLEFIDKYGADALRMALLYGIPAGGRIPLSEDKVKGMRNFSNKIWNVARFVIQNEVKSEEVKTKSDNKDDKWILEELEKTTKLVTEALDKYKLNGAAEEIYDFIWHKFADKYIENCKLRIVNSDANAASTLYHVLDVSLRLLHPFMPFVTEQIWHEMGNKDLLIAAEWPKS